jgi:hypothetical protein
MATKVGAVQATRNTLTEVDSAKTNVLGAVAQDAAGNEYIYLTGVANTVAGSWVTYDEAYLTTLLVADAVGPCAIALAATVASKYGWYCIKGTATGICGDIADNAPIYATATDGSVDDANVAGDLIMHATSRSEDALATTNATFQICYPCVTDVLGT